MPYVPGAAGGRGGKPRDSRLTVSYMTRLPKDPVRATGPNGAMTVRRGWLVEGRTRLFRVSRETQGADPAARPGRRGRKWVDRVASRYARRRFGSPVTE